MPSASANDDYYAFLGVSPNATLEEIKRAYRLAVRTYHPDVNREGGDPELFKRIQEAYRVLSNPALRGEYDAFKNRAGVVRDFVIDVDEGISNRINEFSIHPAFKSTRYTQDPSSASSQTVSRELDIICTLELTPEEAARGGEYTLKITRPVKCEQCQGSGAAAENPEAIIECDICEGEGVLLPPGIERSDTLRKRDRGTLPMAAKCWKCEGDGELITDPCKICRGKGYYEKDEPVAIIVEPNTRDRAVIFVPDGGLTEQELRMLQPHAQNRMLNTREDGSVSGIENEDGTEASEIHGSVIIFIRILNENNDA